MFRAQALVAAPTWAEVQELYPEEVEAMAIIKGECNGDEFLWDEEYYEPKAKKKVKGGWRSRIEELKKPGRPPEGRIRE